MDKKIAPEIDMTKTLLRMLKSYVEPNNLIWLLKSVNKETTIQIKEDRKSVV